MKYPAIDVRGADPDLLLAEVDEFGPSAVETLADGVSVFFATAELRDEAQTAIAMRWPDAETSPRDVDDED